MAACAAVAFFEGDLNPERGNVSSSGMCRPNGLSTPSASPSAPLWTEQACCLHDKLFRIRPRLAEGVVTGGYADRHAPRAAKSCIVCTYDMSVLSDLLRQQLLLLNAHRPLVQLESSVRVPHCKSRDLHKTVVAPSLPDQKFSARSHMPSEMDRAGHVLEASLCQQAWLVVPG